MQDVLIIDVIVQELLKKHYVKQEIKGYSARSTKNRCYSARSTFELII